MQEHIKPVWELPVNEYVLHQEVLKRLGPVAAASLANVLLDGAQRYMGICEGEETFIRDLAKLHKAKLPF